MELYLTDFSKWWDLAGTKSRQFMESHSELWDIVSRPADLTDKLFWEQVATVKNLYTSKSQERSDALHCIAGFYNYIVRAYPEEDVLADARTLLPSFLENKNFISKWIEESYRIVTYTPDLKYDGNDKVVLLVRGKDKETTMRKKEDYILINLSGIESPHYRSLVFLYVVSSFSRANTFFSTPYAVALNVISELKDSAGYENKAETYLTAIEALAVVEHIRENNAKQTGLHYIGAFKSFVTWCVQQKHLTVEDTFYDELKLYTYHSYESRTPKVKDEHIRILLNASEKKAQKSPEQYMAFDTVFRLLLQTNIRIGSICSLKNGCISPSLKPGKYKLHYVTKTSYGDISDETTITSADKLLIDRMINIAERFKGLVTSDIDGYIFLQRPGNRYRMVKVVDSCSFRLYLHLLCRENDLPNYSAINCRKAYMTHVKDHIVDTGKSDAEYRALTRHKSTDTTERHYVQSDIERYFEAMYNVDTMNVTVPIGRSITKTAVPGKELVGEGIHKCGVCRAADCLIRSALPCYVCENFITSPEFLPVFESMLKDIDDKLVNAVLPHEKEDLVSIKEVLVKYVIELKSCQL